MNIYPQRPNDVSENILLPSEEFQKEIKKVLFSIILFFFSYIILVIAAVVFAIILGYIGYYLVLIFPHMLTIILAIALALSGVFVLYFLIKFIFSSNKVDRSHLVEITRKDEPQLFEFIDKVNEETKSPKPKRIYLSNEVNAYVFYDSSFWSMFLPIKKNLTIGLGLINAVNLSEFKAILAHEFGHFSQDSMRWGSYVYNVNQIIFNMLYDNDGLERSMVKMANESSYFAITLNITFSVIRFIQWILIGIYGKINQSYMALSRQMEFHADTISAYVTGGNHLVSSLQRIEIAGICYQNVMSYNGIWVRDGLKSENIYEQQIELTKRFAKNNDLSFKKNQIQVEDDSITKLNRSNLVIDNQWASHPTFEQRANHLKSLNLETDAIEVSAWELFQSPKATQEKFTAFLYKNATTENGFKDMDFSLFKEKLKEQSSYTDLPERYQGFYNDYFPTYIKVKEVDTLKVETKTFEEIFNKEDLDFVLSKHTLLHDLGTLTSIQNKEIDVKYFDYKGVKYNQNKAHEVIAKIKGKVGKIDALIDEKGKQALKFFYNKAVSRGKSNEFNLKLDTAQATIAADKERKIYETLKLEVEPIFHSQMTVDEAKAIDMNIKRAEKPFLELIQNLHSNETNEDLSVGEKNVIDIYLKKEGDYFGRNQFYQNNINKLIEMMETYLVILEKKGLKVKKSFLNYQLTLID